MSAACDAAFFARSIGIFKLFLPVGIFSDFGTVISAGNPMTFSLISPLEVGAANNLYGQRGLAGQGNVQLLRRRQLESRF